MSGISEVIKKAAVDAVKASYPVEVIYGTVETVAPFAVRVNQQLTVKESFITFSDNIKMLMASDRVQKGDKLLLIRQQGGQKFIALDIFHSNDWVPPEGGYLTTEADPTVPAWAKEENKPQYTAEEVGAVAKGENLVLDGSDANFIRMVCGSYGVILRQDGDRFYILPTNPNDQYGSWNSATTGFSVRNDRGFMQFRAEGDGSDVIRAVAPFGSECSVLYSSEGKRDTWVVGESCAGLNNSFVFYNSSHGGTKAHLTREGSFITKGGLYGFGGTLGAVMNKQDLKVATGCVAANFSANSQLNVNITFPDGVFTHSPNVHITALSSAPTEFPRCATAININKTGCTLCLYRTTTTPTAIQWTAIGN